MIGTIIQAVINEAKALLIDSGGTVILKTDYMATNLPSYSMPLLLLDVLDAQDSRQLLGGATMMDWSFAMNSYNYMPDANNNDDTGFSKGLLDVIDTNRQHFSEGNWLTSDMPAIEVGFGFRFTLSGLQPADALDADGLIMGYRILFDSVSIDDNTFLYKKSTDPLAHVVQTVV